MALTVAELLATITLEVSGATAGAAEIEQAATGANEQLTALAEAAGAAGEQLNLFAPAVEEGNQQLSLFSASADESYQALQQFSSGAAEAASSAQSLGGAAGNSTGFMQGMLSSVVGAAWALRGGQGLSGAASAAATGLGALGGVTASSALGMLGVAGGAYELVKGLEAAVQSAVAWGEEVRRVQIVTDLSAQSASDLVVAFNFVGLSTNVAIRSLALFERHIQAGTGAITQYFSATELAAMHNQTLAQMLPEISAKFQSLGSETEKTAFLVGVFGTRIGPQMHNLLALTKDDLAALTQEAKNNGLELSQNQVNAAHNAQLAMNNLALSFKAAEVSLGQELMPVFVQFVKFLGEVIAAVSMTAKDIVDMAQAIGHAASAMWDDFTGNFAGAAHQISAAGDAMKSFANDTVSGWHQIERAAIGTSTAVEQTLQAQIDASKALTDEQQKVAGMQRQDAAAAVSRANQIEKAQDALIKQQQEYNKFIQDEPIKVWVDEVDALKNVYDAELKVTDAQTALNTLLAGPTAEASQKAIDAVDNAVANLFDNQQKVIAAQQAVNDILNPPQRTKDQAVENVAKAQVGVEKATAAVTAAESNLAIVRGYGASTAQQITDATIALQEAQFGQTDANNTLADAQTALSKLTTDAIPGSVALTQAQNNLTLAQDAVKDSVNNLTAAEKAQADLSPSSVASQRAIATASFDLASAQAGLYTQVMNATVAVAEATAFQQGGIPATQAYQDETTKLHDAQFNLSQAITTANDAVISQGEAMAKEMLKLQELDAQYQKTVDAANAAKAAINSVSETPTSQAPPGTYDWNNLQLTGQQAALKSKLISEGIDLTMLNPAVLQSQAWIDFLNSPAGLVWAHQQGLHHDGGIQGPAHHSGGLVVRMHGGGLAADEVSRILQLGEFVINKRAVSSVGAATLAAINSTGQIPGGAGARAATATSIPVSIPIYLDSRQIAIAVRQIFISDIQTGRVTSLGFGS